MNYPLFEFHRDICGWLKFAETKNALLLTLSAAVLQFSLEASAFSWSGWYAILVSVCSAVCVFICLISFSPVMALRSPLFGQADSSAPADSEDVTVFFGAIAQMTERDFCDQYLRHYPDIDAADKALLRQIHTNSMIAQRKMSSFKLSLYALIFGICTPIVGIFVVFWIQNLGPKAVT